VDDPVAGEKLIRDVLGKQGWAVLDLAAVRPSLEDAFVSIVQEKRKGNGS